MKIELLIDGENKTFTTPFAPMLAKRTFLKIMADKEEKEKRGEEYTYKDELEENDAVHAILSDIVFKKEFTLEQLYEGAEEKYIQDKVLEAVYGVKPLDEAKKKESSEGKTKGE